VARCQRSENTIEEKKTDAKVYVHPAGIVQAVVVDIVKTPGASKPNVHYGQSSHPGIAQVHGVMKKAEREERPDNEV